MKNFRLRISYDERILRKEIKIFIMKYSFLPYLGQCKICENSICLDACKVAALKK